MGQLPPAGARTGVTGGDPCTGGLPGGRGCEGSGGAGHSARADSWGSLLRQREVPGGGRGLAGLPWP